MGQILRPVQLRGRDREAGPEPVAGTDNVVRPVGQRPRAGPASAGQRQADATAGGVHAASGQHAAPLDQVEAEASVPHVVQPGLKRRWRRHGQPILAGVSAHGRRVVRQQPRVARAHAHQAHGQVVAKTVDRAQGHRDRVARCPAAAADDLRPVVRQR